MGSQPERLAAALDRLAIEEVINRYFFAADIGDTELIVSCFTEDALVRLMDGESVMRGHDEVREAFGARRGTARLALSDVVGKSHVVGNMRIEIDGDEAQATTLTVAFLKGTVDGRSALMQRGITYTDHLVRQGDEWKITDRLHATRWHHVSSE